MSSEGPGFGASELEEQSGSAPVLPTGEAHVEAVLPAGVADIVSEIRAELADISAHELELRRREQAFAQEYRRLERAARQSAWAEVEQQRQDLARQSVTIQSRIAKLHERESALDARARELDSENDRLRRIQSSYQTRQVDLSGRLERVAGKFRARRAILRQRIDLIRHREEDLQRRIRLARDEIVREREELRVKLTAAEARLAELEQGEHALDARRREIEQAEESLAQRKQQLDQAIQHRRREIEQAIDARRREAEQSVEAKRREAEQALEARRQQVGALEAEHAKARTELDQQHRQLAELQRRLLAERDALRQSRESLGSQDAGLAERQAALHGVEQDLEDRRARFERDAATLDDQRRTIEAKLRDIEARSGALDKREHSLTEKSRALDQSHKDRLALLEREHRERSAALERGHKDRIAALDKSHKDRAAALEREHAQRLETLARSRAEHESQLELRRREVEAEAQSAEARHADLDERQAAVDASRIRASTLEQKSRESLDRAHALREEIELRDNESRQAAMAIEVERQEIARDRGILGQLQNEFDAQRSTQEGELAQARSTLRGWAEQLQTAQRRWGALPARWWLRTAILSATFSVAAALAWLIWQPSVYQARIDFAITATAPEALPQIVDSNLPVGGLASTPSANLSWRARVAGEHARALLDPLLLTGPDENPLARTWSAALTGDSRTAAGVRIWTQSTTSPLGVQLMVSGSPRERVEQLARNAAKSYAERVGTQTVGAGLPDDYFALERWRKELAESQQASEKSLSSNKATRGQLPSPAERSAVVDRAAEAQRELAEVSKSLDRERAALAVLVATESPATAIDPAALQKALDADPIYAEDLQELKDAGTRFRAELQVSLLMLSEPVDALGRTIAKSIGAVGEQIALGPPDSLRETLDAWQAALAAADERNDAFAVTYRRHVKDIDGFALRDDALEAGVLELVRGQGAITQSVDDFAAKAAGLVEDLTKRASTAAEQSGSTREIVVATALRAELSALKSAVEAIGAAAKRCATRDNVELDAADRQLRGLRTRIKERRDLVDGRLRMEAQRSARETLDTQISAARERVRTLDTRREQLVSASLAALDEVRRLDEAARQWDGLSAKIETAETEIARTSEALRELDERLAEIKRRSAEPDRVSAGPVEVSSVETGRGANAFVAGLGAAVATWLIALTLVARPPWRREPQLDLETLLAGPGDKGVDSAA